MAIEFKKEIMTSSFLDPTGDFAEKSLPIEFRYDPLTMDMGVLVEFRAMQPQKVDISQLIAKSPEAACPFCPNSIEKVTPKFVPALCPEGRIKVGEAIVFPNTMPYVPYSAVTVISAKHFVGLTEFTPKMLSDALLASQRYLEKVHAYDPEAEYCSIIWNYMPPAQSSQLHSHLQVFASCSPLGYHRRLLEASGKYREQNGATYWSDSIAEEKRLQERYIATVDNIVWLTSFVPRCSFFDIMAIFRGTGAITSLSATSIDAFTRGLTRVFKYMDDENFYSFNLCLYSGMPQNDTFWTLARIIPRALMPPLGMSDVGNFTLLNDTSLIMKSPESVCRELRPYFG
jgi:galactose-1-phosphate uridylyltransferase